MPTAPSSSVSKTAELPITMQPIIASEEIGGNGEMADEDYDIADGFMSALGC